jgi:voltage-gated potassium channel
LEGYTAREALYMVIITLSTVGFEEVHQLSPAGEILVMVMIVTGLVTMTYCLKALAEVFLEGQIQTLLGRRMMQREIGSLKDHYIVCGFGRMGRILCQELKAEEVSFVVVENRDELAEELQAEDYLVLRGDATEDEALGQAGIARAKGLVAVVSNDVDNLFIVLSAREMTRRTNPGLYILARATDMSATKKIERAGANRVISPYHIGGMRLVQALLRPTVYDFVEVVTQSSGLDLKIEEFTVASSSAVAGTAIRDSGLRQTYDVIIFAIKKDSGEMVFNPGPAYVIEAGDVLISMGDRQQVKRLRDAVS